MRAHAAEPAEMRQYGAQLVAHQNFVLDQALHTTFLEHCNEFICDGVRLLSVWQFLRLLQVKA